MSDLAIRKLRNWLSANSLPEGTRLPPERALAETLSVSRAELRKALLVLETEGRLDRHVGRGTFLRDPQKSSIVDAASLAVLAERTGPHEAMLARLMIEPELARLAAFHATPRQISELKTLSSQMRRTGEWEAYEDLDAAFHDLIAESAGNPLLHEVSRIVNSVRKAVVWGRLFLPANGPTEDYHSFAEHDAIVAALDRRDRAGARDAMRKHIESTLSTMMADD